MWGAFAAAGLWTFRFGIECAMYLVNLSIIYSLLAAVFFKPNWVGVGKRESLNHYY